MSGTQRLILSGSTPGLQQLRSCAVRGRPGKSAYELALDNGFSGTEAEWLASLTGAQGETGSQGPAGADGAAGRSAYEIALDNGFSGTEAQWLASLTGPQGATGPQGPAGEGLPSGGTTGQFLIKVNDASYACGWVTVPNANGGSF